MRKALSLGPIGGFGVALYKIGDNSFTYNGDPSVNVSFDIKKEVVSSLTFKDPELEIVANKIS